MKTNEVIVYCGISYPSYIHIHTHAHTHTHTHIHTHYKKEK